MQLTHLAESDLNLLLRFLVLIEERNITRAGKRMFMSQTGMSRVFNRLQEMLGDVLLVRSATGYEPTPRALHIYSELNRLLPELEELFRGKTFDAAQATETFRIAATDHSTALVLGRVFCEIARIAPGIQINVSTIDHDVAMKLESNAIDLAFRLSETPQTLRSEPLYKDGFVCVMRKGHPLGKRPLTLKRYLDQDHLAIAPATGQVTHTDVALERLGYRRRIRVSVPYFSSVATILEGTNLIATLSTRLAKHLGSTSSLRVVRTPIDFGGFTLMQVWHPRNDLDPRHKWLREHIKKVAASV